MNDHRRFLNLNRFKIRAVHLACALFAGAVGCAEDSPDVKPPAKQTSSDQNKSKPLEKPAWPNWMGPNHDGVSKEKGLAVKWPSDGLKQVWTKEIGIGFSSVSIVDGRLFTMGHVEGKEYVYCLNADTGEQVWTHSYSCELVANLYEGGPGCTPTVDGDFVYTVGKTGQLFCFQAADGKIVWRKALQDDLGVSLPEWGFNGSPYILGEQLILEAGRVVSYNKTTGRKNWETEPHRAGYGSAAAFSHGGRTLLATLDCDGLRIVQAADGKQIAFKDWPSPFGTNSTTPIVKDDLIYISSGYNVGCGLFRIQNDSLEKVYANREMRNHFNNSILIGDHLYGFDGNSNLGRVVHLKCVHFKTGELAWRHRGLGCGSLMAADGKLILLSDDGELVLAEASAEGYRELARSSFLEGRCWTVPVLLNQRIYGRNAEGKLVCVRLPQGK